MSKGTYSHSNRHRMHEKRDEPFVITEARNMGRSFWKEMQAYRQTVDELRKENEELKKDKERLARLLARLYENASTELRAIYRDDFNEAMNQQTQ